MSVSSYSMPEKRVFRKLRPLNIMRPLKSPTCLHILYCLLPLLPYKPPLTIQGQGIGSVTQRNNHKQPNVQIDRSILKWLKGCTPP